MSHEGILDIILHHILFTSWRNPGTMLDMLQTFALAFVVGLTGALAPGPTLVATVNASIAGGWTMGPRVTLGHMLSELIIVVLIVAGLATVALQYTTAVAVIGGVALILFGIFTVLGSRQVSLARGINPESAITKNPYFAGFMTSVANPYFWIWWLTVGGAMVIAGLAGGILLACVFMIGHWCADLGWYTVVSSGIAKGKTILSDSMYQRIMLACGLFLVVFGAYYLVSVAFPLV
ncbi:LysE family translocator [Methanoregula sp.]|uniref:LysE family translocator n=1 Tax=Methanoregula sp. TaxID=2052170 RepID=UPI003C766221